MKKQYDLPWHGFPNRADWHSIPNARGHSTDFCHRHEDEGSRLAQRRALSAMATLGTPAVQIRSRTGMVRMLQAAYGPETRVRWSWPPVARAHRSRGWS